MKRFQFCIIVFMLFFAVGSFAGTPKKSYKALVLTERGGLHEGFVLAALDWLNEFGEANNITFTECNHAAELTEDVLKNYDVFIQLNYPPYMWSDESEKAFTKLIEEGQIGWVGFHHAALLGEFDGYPMWNWFSDFMGGIRFKNYIAELASGTVRVEDQSHPVMKGVSGSFVLKDDEWYTFDKNPRPNVHVLANVNEGSYDPPSDITMGDHPAVWVNTNKKARNLYFLMGHHADLLKSKDFVKMFGNAILWAAGKKQ